MIYKRVAARLGAQDWVAISIELGIVIIGVFVGTWVADWNQQRSERREVDQALQQVRPELARMRAADTLRTRYYRTTDQFAQVALAGWAGDPHVSDRDFVVAAYQASQVTWIPGGSPLVATALGTDQVRRIADPALRAALLRVINFSYDSLTAGAMQTRYREDVRETLPYDIQQAVRQACGDRSIGNGMLVLAEVCAAPIAPASAAAGARALRSQPELTRELRFHLSQASNFIFNSAELDHRVATLQERLAARFDR